MSIPVTSVWSRKSFQTKLPFWNSSGWLAAQAWRFGRLVHWTALIPAAHPVGGGRARRRDRRARGAASSGGRRRSPLGFRAWNAKWLWILIINHILNYGKWISIQ